MNSHVQIQQSGKTRALFLAAAILPVLLYTAIRFMGLMSMAQLGLIAVAGAAGAGVIIVRPQVGALFMIFYVYAGLRFYFPALVSIGVMGVTAVAVVLSLFRNDKLRVNDGLFWGAVGVFILITLQSMLWAVDYGLFADGFTKLVKVILLTLLIAQLIKTPKDLRTFGMWIFIGGVGTVGLGLLNLKFGLTGELDIIGGVNMLRFTGLHDNPNYAAAIMLSTLPMGLFFIKHERRLLTRLVAVAGVLILITAIFYTFSRAALVTFGALAVGVLAREVRSRRACLLVLLLLVVGILLTPRFYWARVMAVADLSESVVKDWSFYLRYTALREAWATFLRHPLTGVGLSNFQVTSADVMFARIGAHNMYLELLADVGLLGFLSYFGVHVSAVRQMIASIRDRWRDEDSWIRDFSYYLMLSLLAGLVSGLTADIHLNYALWIPVAFGISIANLRKHFAV